MQGQAISSGTISDADDGHFGNGALCQRCSRLDVNLLFSGSELRSSDLGLTPESIKEYRQGRSRVYINLGLLSAKDQKSNCPVCRFWSSCRFGNDDQPYALLEVPFEGSRYWAVPPLFAIRNLHGPDSRFPLMKLVPSHHGGRPCDIAQRSDLVDFGLVRSWMEHCRKEHDECSMDEGAGGSNDLISVIDCHTGEVHEASSGVQYAALSYVWGTDQARPAVDSAKGVMSFPLLIRDAMSAAKFIGLHYLWVDRYCIIESDQMLKMEQIRNMDVIFARAQVVIISLGRSPDEGLPGVSTTLRNPQPCLRVQQGEVRSTMGDSHHHIRDSTWNQRAWTLQEAFLSRRRLFFTKEQVYFECKSTRTCEIMDTVDEDRRGVSFRATFSPNWLKFAPGEHLSVFGLDNLLQGYCGRNMTYASDALPAFLGILSKYAKTSRSHGHYFGLPFHMPFDEEFDSLSKRQAEVISGFLRALCWHPAADLKAEMRRQEFPSWTWAGWTTGYLHPFSDFRHDGVPQHRRQVQVWVEMLDGTLETIMDFIEGGGLRLPMAQLSSFIWLEALHVSMTFIDFNAPTSADSQMYMALTWDSGEGNGMFYVMAARICPAVAQSEVYNKWQIILLGEDTGPPGNLTALVVADRDGITERVDCIYVRSPLSVDVAVPNKVINAFPGMQLDAWNEIRWTLKKTRLG